MGDFLSVAGVDVHKDSISITMLFQEGGKWKQEYFESQTFSQDLIIAGKKIKSKKITEVAMESTGIYWKPIFHIWNERGLRLPWLMLIILSVYLEEKRMHLIALGLQSFTKKGY